MLKENVQKILSEISGGNDLGEKITLVGATKTVDADTINEAISYGLEVVAENKVQEFREKTDLIKGVRQQFIGHLQTNKVKYLIGKVELIQSVDTINLAQVIDKESKKKNVITNILIEINAGGELTKSGFSFDNAIDAVLSLSGLENVKIVGLMAMLPNSEDEEYLASLCRKTRDLYDKLKAKLPFSYLSIGMTHDYKIAIRNGSNMIRIGSAVFGKRNYEVKNGNV